MVESIESSLVSKPLKSSKSRCFNVVGCSPRQIWFHKRLHHR
ncbi:general secretion pathway protein GspH [Vibrio vulnificus]|nr:general secretion pathway protein GspH [Vibrio vulnificus]POC65013.1 general secretion pathway protein GspH [Vibrio vulnificus Env1]